MLPKQQTRGRPKKYSCQQLPSFSRKLFSQHCAVFYACCMVYVLQTFINTKHQKRIGHSEGGFTIYQKLNEQYCFENYQIDCEQWGFQSISKIQELSDFVRIVNGCAPKVVFKELLTLFEEIITFLQRQKIQSIQSLEQNQYKLWNLSEIDLNKKYKYIRFTHSALKELKMQKWNFQVSSKIKELWGPFICVNAYTIFCVLNKIQTNKYLKPFFSDAQHPQQTLIGQLNLQQIVNNQNCSSPLRRRHSMIQSQQNLSQRNRYNSQCQLSNNGQDHLNLSQINLSHRNSNLRPVTFITHPSLQLSDSSKNQEESFNQNQLQSKINQKQNKKRTAIVNIFNYGDSLISLDQNLQEKNSLELFSKKQTKQGDQKHENFFVNEVKQDKIIQNKNISNFNGQNGKNQDKYTDKQLKRSFSQIQYNQCNHKEDLNYSHSTLKRVKQK